MRENSIERWEMEDMNKSSDSVMVASLFLHIEIPHYHFELAPIVSST